MLHNCRTKSLPQNSQTRQDKKQRLSLKEKRCFFVILMLTLLILQHEVIIREVLQLCRLQNGQMLFQQQQ